MRDMKIGTRLVEFREDTLADLTGLVNGAFSKENDNLTKLPIRTFCNNIRYRTREQR